MGEIHVHEFMTLDGVADAPMWTMEFGFTDSMAEVIGGVTERSSAILLGRNRAWPSCRWSTLAGFCEPGETLEDAVRREPATGGEQPRAVAAARREIAPGAQGGEVAPVEGEREVERRRERARVGGVAAGRAGVGRAERPEPLALTAASPPPVSSHSTYSIGAYTSRHRRVAPSFPEEPGHLL